MTNSTDIAERIESARRVGQRSVAWLSEQTGIAEKTYRRRVAAPEQFTIGELSQIASALGLDFGLLFRSPDAVTLAAHSEGQAA